ncbi:MAG: hypothetical protein ACO1QB_11955 [Verrucomicrobiales bacterium]
MLSSWRKILALLFLLCSLRVEVFSAAAYRVIELGIPDQFESSFPSAINASGEVVGYAKDKSGRSTAFHWKNGDLQMLTGFGEGSEALALNDEGTIVGRALTNGIWKAWVHANGTDTQIDTLPDQSEAVAINNSGAIVGNSYSPGYWVGYLWAPRQELLAASAGGINGPGDIRIVALSEMNAVLTTDFLIRNINKPTALDWLEVVQGESASYVSRISEGKSVNSIGTVGGYFKGFMGATQPGLYRGDDWVPLGAPLQEDGSVVAVNNKNEAVGYGNGGKAPILWKNEYGLELSSLMDFPSNVSLQSATGINDQGWIIATITENSSSRAVLLQPLLPEIEAPNIRVLGVTNGMLMPSGAIKLELDVPADHVITKARYVIYQRGRSEASGAPPFMNPPTYTSYPFRTNETTLPPFKIDLELPAGEFALVASADVNGMSVHLPPLFF